MKKKENKTKMWWRKPSLVIFRRKMILTQSTKQINHKHPIKLLIHQKKTEEMKSIDKSRSTQRTDTVNIVDKSRFIPRTYYF